MNKKSKHKPVSKKRFIKVKYLSFQFIIPMLILIVLVGIGWYQFHSKKPVIKGRPFLTTYDQCAQLKDSQIINTYPKKCESEDGTEFIEILKEPVDTTNWDIFTDIEGIAIKCPPGWMCRLNELNKSSMSISSEIPGIAHINLFFIGSNNFQESLIRHPNYNNPISWLNAVKGKNDFAITTYDNTIIPVDGTDGKSYPAYYQANFDTISIISTKHGDGIVMPREYNDTSVVIPVTNSEVILSISQPATFYKNLIWKAIIESIIIE